MKTAILALFGTLVFNSNSARGMIAKNHVYQTIDNTVGYSERLKKSYLDDFVAIEFIITKEGAIKILASNFSDAVVYDYIQKELATIQFQPGQYETDKRHFYKFSFENEY